MPSHHAVDFYRLPDRNKRQIARSIADADHHLQEEAPSNKMFYAVRGAGLALLVLQLGGSVFKRFGRPGADPLWNSPGSMVLYALLIAAIAWLALVMRQRYVLNRDFKFAPGQYLFPYTLIDARRAQMQVVDLSQMQGVHIVEHHVNNVYKHTTYEFRFADAPSRIWKIRSKGRAEYFGTKLRALQTAAHGALQRNDTETLLKLDPFIEIRKKNWAMPQRDPVARSRLQVLLARPLPAALALALIIAPVLWLVRNAGGDLVMQAEARHMKTEQAYLWYIENGWFNVREMRAAVPRVAFEEVRQRNSVTALRGVLARYPAAGLQADVAREIHVLYQRSLAKFKEQAITSDPALLATMENLLRVLEQRGDPKVAIHFTRPTPEALGGLDALILQNEAHLGGKKIIPAAIHFHNDSAAPREARIAAGLQQAFSVIFANDVLDLRVNANAMLPMLDIHYQIAPSGVIYVSEQDDQKLFVGLIARFQAALKVEAALDPWRFDMEVLPPNRFTVDYQMPSGAFAVGMPESLVYSVMAERAFDELDAKIMAAFFRPDSVAMKRRAEATKARELAAQRKAPAPPAPFTEKDASEILKGPSR